MDGPLSVCLTAASPQRGLAAGSRHTVRDGLWDADRVGDEVFILRLFTVRLNTGPPHCIDGVSDRIEENAHVAEQKAHVFVFVRLRSQTGCDELFRLGDIQVVTDHLIEDFLPLLFLIKLQQCTRVAFRQAAGVSLMRMS